MMNGDTDLLIQSAARLYTLGVDLEAARAELRRLVDMGVPYDAPAMREACENCEALQAQWKALEQEHLSLREELTRRQSRMEDTLRDLENKAGGAE